MTFLRFNRLYVIESLEEEEVKTGTELFKYLQPVIEASQFNLPIGLFTCEAAHGFRDIAAEILTRTRAGHLPWVHIDCHASDDDGLVFANGSELRWDDVCNLLRPINEACGFQLFVVVSSCYGASMVTGIDTGQGAPCIGLLGPSEEVSPAELLGHFRDFYRALIETADIGAAIESWTHRSLQQGAMVVVTADDWWRTLMFEYLSKNATKEAIAESARRQRKILLVQGTTMSIGHLKRMYRQNLPRVVEKRFSSYFMIEQVPENTERFAKLHREMHSWLQQTQTR